MRRPLKSLIKLRYRGTQLAVFVVLTYALAWSSWFSISTPFVQKGGIYFRILGSWHGIPGPDLFVLLGNLSPGIAALITITLASGKTGLADLWRRSTAAHASFAPYAIACLLPIAYSYFSLVILHILGTQAAHLDSPFRHFIDLALTLPFAPLFEEIGWRGYLLPKLEKTTGDFRSSVLVGLIWGPWHAPLLLMAPHPGMALLDVLIVFCILTIGLSILFTWTFNWSRGLLLPVILLHGFHNAATSYFLSSTISAGGWMPLLILTVIVWLAATAVLIIGRMYKNGREEWRVAGP